MSGRRIAIIDDDIAVRESLTIVLELIGHEVKSAATCDDGLMLLRDFTPDIILADVMMSTDGTQIVTAVKRAVPGARVVAMSGGARVGDKTGAELAREWGADVALAKPFDEDKLLDAISDEDPPPAA